MWALPARASDSLQIMQRIIKSSPDPSEKLHFINHLITRYWHKDPDSAIYYGRQGLALIKKNVVPEEKAKLNFAYAVAHKYSGNPDSAYWYLSKSRILSHQLKNNFLYHCSLEQIANIYREQGKYDSARILLEQSVEYFKKTKNASHTNTALINLGSVWLDQNRNTKALQYYLEAYSYLATTTDTISTALTLRGIGMVCENLGSLFKTLGDKKSVDYFNNSIECYKMCFNSFSQMNYATGIEYATINLMSAYLNAEMLQNADSVYRYSKFLTSSKDSQTIMLFRILYARMLNEKGNKAEAMEQLRLVEGMHNQPVIPHVYYESMMLMADLLRGNGEIDSAYSLANISIDWFLEKQNYLLAYPALLTLSKWQQEDGNSKEAYQTLSMATSFFDFLFIEATNEILNETTLAYENDLLQLNLETIRSEKEKEHTHFRIMILIISLIILLMIFIILFLNQRGRKLTVINQQAKLEAIQNQQVNVIMDLKLKDLTIEKQLFEEKSNIRKLELQIKDQELVYQSLRQADITQFNKTTIQKLIPFQIRMTRKKDQDLFSQLITEISHLSEKDPLADFELMFSQMHGDFHRKLIELAPDLSRSEVQISALLRMNLPSKEIARLTNLSLATVDLTRHHIRQKLKLESTQNLIAYLIML